MSSMIPQLLWSLPGLFVYVLALVLGFLNLERARRPAILTIGAASVLIVTNLGGTLLRIVVFSSGSISAGSQALTIFTAVNMLSSIVSAICYSVIVAAVFLDRASPIGQYGPNSHGPNSHGPNPQGVWPGPSSPFGGPGAPGQPGR